MKTALNASLVLLSATVVLCAAQSPIAEKHADEIRSEQPDGFIRASQLCVAAKANGRSSIHTLRTEPNEVIPDLAALMQKSDEVILVGISYASTVALSPSGNDIAEYRDVRVLRSWKGTHKTNDAITFAVPNATVSCTSPLVAAPSIETTPAIGDWKGFLWGPAVLFLRQSQGDERSFLPGYRLAGGNGLQGLFVIPFLVHDSSCAQSSVAKNEACAEKLAASQIAIFDPFRRDPLLSSYEGMPAATFLKQIDSTAASLGYPAPAVRESAKK